MKVNGIGAVSGNLRFKSVYNSSPCSKDCNCKKNDYILKTGLVALGILGSATALYCVAKKNNMSVVQFVKNSINKAKSYFSDKPEPNVLDIILKDKRDAQAVKLYKGYIAKNKMDSLHKKLLAGEFDGKSKEVFKHIRRNEMRLRREASFVGQAI